LSSHHPPPLPVKPKRFVKRGRKQNQMQEHGSISQTTFASSSHDAEVAHADVQREDLPR
jgi:hypothetical protein